jgi:hypothetical protein
MPKKKFENNQKKMIKKQVYKKIKQKSKEDKLRHGGTGRHA